MNKKIYRDKTVIKKRLFVIFIVLVFLFIALIGRLSYIMIQKSPEYKKKAVDQWTSEVKISAKRGRILDRNGNELAVSANVYRVDLDLNTLRKTMKDKKMSEEEVASKLSKAIDMDEKKIVKIIKKKLPNGVPYGSAMLKRRIEKSMADKVKQLNIRGVIVSADTKRYYPNNNFLAHVLGHTNSDGEGLTGIEMMYNSELSGVKGKRITEMDNTKSSELPYTISDFTKPKDGKDVILTIDEMIQNFAEKAADQALNDTNAKNVSILVMNPNNGEVLALVNKPDYNPNNPWVKGKTSEELQALWRNRVVNDTFEPGSIFKVITAATALSENSVSSTDKFTCNGAIKIGSNTIHCWKHGGHGTQKFVDILKNSCNVGFIQLGRKIGKEKLNEYIKRFGLGHKTGVDLPGEAKGIIKKTEDITEVDLATISFGQTNTVSMIQYLTAFNSVANGGKWIRPHLLKETGSYDEQNGKEVMNKKFDNYGEKQILDPNKMSILRGYLEKVVSEGGGGNAFIEGYHIAGKTGTAKKVLNGKYGNQLYISSFAGMAPAEKPKVTVLVSVDEPDPTKPSGYYASQTATPVARQVFDDIFNYMAFSSEDLEDGIGKELRKNVMIPEIRGMKKSEAQKILKENKLVYDIDSKGEYITDVNPKPGYTVKEGTKLVLYTGSTSNYNKVVVVPNLKGYTLKRASDTLNKIGLKVKYEGKGLVNTQNISPGKEINKGSTILLNLKEMPD